MAPHLPCCYDYNQFVKDLNRSFLEMRLDLKSPELELKSQELESELKLIYLCTCIWVEAYRFSATSFSKWPSGGHIGFFSFWTLQVAWFLDLSITLVGFGIWVSNFMRLLLMCCGWFICMMLCSVLRPVVWPKIDKLTELATFGRIFLAFYF